MFVLWLRTVKTSDIDFGLYKSSPKVTFQDPDNGKPQDSHIPNEDSLQRRSSLPKALFIKDFPKKTNKQRHHSYGVCKYGDKNVRTYWPKESKGNKKKNIRHTRQTVSRTKTNLYSSIHLKSLTQSGNSDFSKAVNEKEELAANIKNINVKTQTENTADFNDNNVGKISENSDRKTNSQKTLTLNNAESKNVENPIREFVGSTKSQIHELYAEVTESKTDKLNPVCETGTRKEIDMSYKNSLDQRKCKQNAQLKSTLQNSLNGPGANGHKAIHSKEKVKEIRNTQQEVKERKSKTDEMTKRKREKDVKEQTSKECLTPDRGKYKNNDENGEVAHVRRKEPEISKRVGVERNEKIKTEIRKEQPKNVNDIKGVDSLKVSSESADHLKSKSLNGSLDLANSTISLDKAGIKLVREEHNDERNINEANLDKLRDPVIHGKPDSQGIAQTVTDQDQMKNDLQANHVHSLDIDSKTDQEKRGKMTNSKPGFESNRSPSLEDISEESEGEEIQIVKDKTSKDKTVLSDSKVVGNEANNGSIPAPDDKLPQCLFTKNKNEIETFDTNLPRQHESKTRGTTENKVEDSVPSQKLAVVTLPKKTENPVSGSKTADNKNGRETDVFNFVEKNVDSSQIEKESKPTNEEPQSRVSSGFHEDESSEGDVSIGEDRKVDTKLKENSHDSVNDIDKAKLSESFAFSNHSASDKNYVPLNRSSIVAPDSKTAIVATVQFDEHDKSAKKSDVLQKHIDNKVKHNEKNNKISPDLTTRESENEDKKDLAQNMCLKSDTFVIDDIQDQPNDTCKPNGEENTDRLQPAHNVSSGTLSLNSQSSNNFLRQGSKKANSVSPSNTEATNVIGDSNSMIQNAKTKENTLVLSSAETKKLEPVQAESSGKHNFKELDSSDKKSANSITQSGSKSINEIDNSGDSGKENSAQAQARDEQRKISSVPLSIGQNSLPVGSNSLPAIQQQQSQQPPAYGQRPQQQQQYQQPIMTQATNPARSNQPQSSLQSNNVAGNISSYTALPYSGSNSNAGNPVEAPGFPPSYTNDYRSQPSSNMPNIQNGYQAPYSTYNLPQTNSVFPQTYSQLDHQDSQPTGRHRRVGRDHTNYVLPPGLATVVNTQPINYAQQAQRNTAHGDSNELTERTDKGSYSVYDSEGMGLELVILDKSDDEDDLPSDRNVPQNNPPTAPLRLSNNGVDVYPVDPQAVDRDMYKQELDTPRQPGFQKEIPQRRDSDKNTAVLDSYRDNANINSSSLDSETSAQDTGRSFDQRNLPPNQFQLTGDRDSNPYGSYPDQSRINQRNLQDVPQTYSNLQPPPNHSRMPYNQRDVQNRQQQQRNDKLYNNSHQSQPPDNNTQQQHGHKNRHANDNYETGQGPLYSMSQIDYDRFTSIPSALSTIREGGISQMDTYRTDNSGGDPNDISNQSLLLPDDPNQQWVNSSYPVTSFDQLYAPSPDFKIRTRPGYKFEIQDEMTHTNRATRANILSRAEQLVVAMREQKTDRSDSSEENKRVHDGYDEGDDGSRHNNVRHARVNTLRHINRRGYDDSASFNSSDDVLNNIRYHPRGPVSKAARRARLTSVNARLTKQRRLKAGRRTVGLSAEAKDDKNIQSPEKDKDSEPEKGDKEKLEKESNSYEPDNGKNGPILEVPLSSLDSTQMNATPSNNGKPNRGGQSRGGRGRGKGGLGRGGGRGWGRGGLRSGRASFDSARNESMDHEDNLISQPKPPKAEKPKGKPLRKSFSTNSNPFKSKDVLGNIASSRESSNVRPPISDADNTSEDDVMDPPLTYRRPLDDDERYEEALLRDGHDAEHLNRLQQQQLQEQGGGPVSSDGVVAKGRIVYFYRNGDVHYKPKQVLINSKRYLNLSILLVDLSGMVPTSTGVKHIFSWPEGREIKSITEFEHGRSYICSSTKKLQRVDYGNSRETHFKHGKVDRKENYLFQHDGKIQSPLRRPRVLTIISNMYRDSREKLILNTNSSMNFEDILTDIVNMVNIPNPPVRALYTERKPHTKVESYSQLIRDFADHENFLACGEEMIPLELAHKRDTDGIGKKGRKKILAGLNDMNKQRDGADSSPTRSSDASSSVVNKQQSQVRRKKTDSVRVDINGKTREFFPPTTIEEEDDGLKPDKKLRLDWVYGFRGRDVKQNLSVLPSSGELVYFVAAVVVVYDKKFGSQKHYLGHSEEITCLTIHPNGRFVATGQTAGKTPESGAHVRIWDGMSLSTYAVIGLGVFQQGITCVNFSEKDSHISDTSEASSGDLLMAIDDSERHVLTVWEWQTEKMVARTTTTPDPVVSGCFYPFDDSILVTFGKEHIHFWRMFWEKGRKIMRDKLSGNFEDDVPKFVTSICFSPSGDVITGDSTGAILIWTRDNNSVFAVNDTLSMHTKRAHKKSVSALCMLGDGTLLSGGGNEVKAWDSINSYSLVKERVLPETAGHVRSIVPISSGGLDGSIYVATTRNKVLEGSLQLKFKMVIQGHVEELWAVESHPLEQTFISAGHDQAVVKWSAVSHAPVWRVNVENPCTSISIDPKGRLIALGTTSGKVIILNSYNGIQLTTLLSGTAQINALNFSPDGMMLAVGTFDGQIQIFYVQDEGHHFFRSQSSSMKCSNVFIMHVDWSIDGKLIQAVMGDYDIAYWDITTMKRVKGARSLRDVKWATHNCPIGHSIIGPWQNVDRGDVINVVSRSQYRDLMVVGDSKGRLRLYKWPCSVPKAGYRSTKVFSSNVTCAVFSCDDSYVIASGGNDAALMQFSVLDPVNTR